MTKQYRKNKRRICVVICLVLCMISGIKIQAAQPGYFDNPQTVYDEFAGKIYDRSFKKSYAFLKKKMNVFETSSGSKKIGVAPRYSGVIVVSKTSDHVQVIYEKKKAYGIVSSQIWRIQIQQYVIFLTLSYQHQERLLFQKGNERKK